MPTTDGSAAAAAESPPRAAPPPFRGFASPNYTPVPDELFDELLVELSGGELKALLYIIRRTFGFKRDSDTISISQMLFGIQTRDGRVLDRGIGLSKKTLLAALRTLEERGIIHTERRQSAEKGNEPTVYRLNVQSADGTPSTPPPPPAPASPPPMDPVENTAPPLGGKSTPPLGEKFPQALGGKTTPSPWGKNSPTQKRVKQNTVEQQTGTQKTAGSTCFDLLATMQQEREPSGFSKPTRSDAFSRQTEFSPSPAVSERAPRSEKSPSARLSGPMRAENGKGCSREQPVLFEPQNRPTERSADRPQTDDAASSRRGARRPPPPKLPTHLAGLVTRYSEELHDEEHIPQNLGQAGRLWDASNCSESTFAEALSKAKAITLQRDIKKRAAQGWEVGARNKMPYYFKVLRDVLGLTEASGQSST